MLIGSLEIIPKGLVQGLEDLEIKRQVETIQNHCITEISQNTVMSSWNLRRLAVTLNLVKDRQSEVAGKALKELNNNNAISLRSCWVLP